ncbi:Calx-beta domain-containing protein [Rubinisphaera margarita]|uniref:Calx-beta domain-containing protein n=1 Tax=Rubinisphaera margarita TaxID=2909586 RepID=UPI001EE8130C|nr:Calx-beta domain-containing protein [Rubinisphaera margarita]MCG6156690.1 FG-GAP-like repeat-containing protein [Rubinisphaera margarita]
MMFQSRSQSTRISRRRAETLRPQFGASEVLEGRTLLAGLTVNTQADNTTSDNELTLREAVLLINNGGDANAALGRVLTAGESAQINVGGGYGSSDQITFDAALSGSSILLTSGTLSLSQSVLINGLGAENLTISGNNAARVFTVQSGTIHLAHLTIADGLAQGGDGGASEFGGGGGGGAGLGGGVFVNTGANVTIQNVILSGNQAVGGDGGDAGVPGAGTSTVAGGFTSTGGTSGTSSFVDGNFGVGGAGGAGTTVDGNAGSAGSQGNFAGGGGGGGGGGLVGNRYNAGAGGQRGVVSDGLDVDDQSFLPGVGNGKAGSDGHDSAVRNMDGFSLYNADIPAGTGGGGGGGAGLGGGIFVRSGSTLTVVDSYFEANEAIGGDPGRRGEGYGVGKGGSIFAMDGVTVNHYGTTFGHGSQLANFGSTPNQFPSSPATPLDYRQGLWGTFSRTLPMQTYVDGPAVPASLEYSYLNAGIQDPDPNILEADGGTATLVSDILARLGRGGLRSEVAAPTALAITSIDSSNGLWQYSDNGTDWTDLTDATESNALLLSDTWEVRFVPNEGFNTVFGNQPTMTFRSWDETGGVAGDFVDTSTNGGGTPFSTYEATAVVNVSDPTFFDDGNDLFPSEGVSFFMSSDEYFNNTFSLDSMKTTGSREFRFTLTGVGGVWAAGPSVSSIHMTVKNGLDEIYGYATTRNGVLQFASTDAFTTANGNVSHSIFNANIHVGDFTDVNTDSGAIAIIRSQTSRDAGATHFKVEGITGGTLYKDAAFTQAVVEGEFISYGNGNVYLYFRPDVDFAGEATYTTIDSTSNNDGGLLIQDGYVAQASTTDAITLNQSDMSSTHIKITGITNGTLYLDAAKTMSVSNGDFVAWDGATVDLYFEASGGVRRGTGSFTYEESTSSDDPGLLGGPTQHDLSIIPDHVVAVLAPIVTLAATHSEIVEGDSGTTTINYTVRRSSTDSSTLPAATYNYAVTGDVNADDFAGGVLPSGSVVFAEGQTEATFSIQVTGDIDAESDEDFTVTLSNIPSAYTTTDANATTTITADDTSMALAVSTASVLENGATNIVYTFTRSGVVTDPMTANFDIGGTATFNTDYTQSGAATFDGTNGTVTFAANVTTATVTITPTGDTTVELNETVTLTLASGTGYDIVTAAAVGSTISNDDSATFSIDDVTHDEDDAGTTSYVFTVTLNNAVDTSIDVDYVTANNTATSGSGDYTALASDTLTFNGTAGETKTITVLVNGDETTELDESFFVNLSSIVASGRNVTFADSQGLGTITNDDSSTVSINDVSIAEGLGGTTNLVFSATLNNAVDAGFSVDFASADNTAAAGTDYTANSGTLNFAGTAGETETITIVLSGDQVVELNETFYVNLSNLVIAGGRDVTIADAQGIGTITNDDAAGFWINDVALDEEDDGVTSFTFTVTLDAAVDVQTTVDVSTTGGTATAGSDYTAISGQTLTFAGNAGETQTFTLQVNGDEVVEFAETVRLTLSNHQVSGRNVGLSDSEGSAVILNDDQAGLTINDVFKREGNGGGQTAYDFHVQLDKGVDGAFQVDYRIDDVTAYFNSDFTIVGGNQTGTLNFTGQAGEQKTLTINVNADSNVEYDETFQVALFDLMNGGLDIVLSDATATGFIGNDDRAIVSVADVATAEDQSPTVELTLDNTVDQNVTVQYEIRHISTDARDFSTLTGTATILAGHDDETVLLPVIADGEIEYNEQFEFVITSVDSQGAFVSVEDDTALVTIRNDDSSTITGRSNGNWYMTYADADGNYTNNLAAASPGNILESFQGDFNGDGEQDIALRMENGDWQIGLWSGEGHYNFENWGNWRTNDVRSIVVGDFNNDGRDDIAGLFRAGQMGRWWVAESSGSDFTNRAWGLYGKYDNIDQVVVGQFDGVRGSDLAILANTGVWWLTRSATGQFSNSLGADWRGMDSIDHVSVGDFNNDGRDDITAIRQMAGQNSARSDVALSAGSIFNTRTWKIWNNVDASNIQAAVAGDFNGDQSDDIAVIINSSEWHVGLSGDNRFQTSLWLNYDASVSGLVDLHVGQSNGDEYADILARRADTQRWISLESTGTALRGRGLITWNPDGNWEHVQVQRNEDDYHDPAGSVRRHMALPAGDFEAFGDSELLDQLFIK